MPSLKELLVGAKINDVIEGTSNLFIKLEDGRCLVVEESGGPGLDSNWYNYPAVYLDDKEVWHG